MHPIPTYVFHSIVSFRKITAISGAIAGFRKNASEPVEVEKISQSCYEYAYIKHQRYIVCNSVHYRSSRYQYYYKQYK